MKIYISKLPCDDTSYVHISDISTLDMLVDDGEAVSIVVEDFLTSVPYVQVGPILHKICSKLAINGTISLYHLDINIICYWFNRGTLDLQALNSNLFKLANGTNCVINTDLVCDLLKQKGFNIELKQFDMHKAIVTARRPS